MSTTRIDIRDANTNEPVMNLLMGGGGTASLLEPVGHELAFTPSRLHAVIPGPRPLDSRPRTNSSHGE